MKQIAILLFAANFILISSSFGQIDKQIEENGIQVTTSESIKGKGYAFSHISKEGNYVFYNYGKKNKSIIISTLTKEFIKVKSVTIKLPKAYEKLKISKLSLSDERLYLESWFANLKDEKIYFFKESFNVESGTTNDDFVKYGEIETEGKIFKTLGVVYSPNKKFKAYLFSRDNDKNGISSTKFIVAIFNNNSQVSTKSFGLTERNLKSYSISNSGSIYFLSKNKEVKSWDSGDDLDLIRMEDYNLKVPVFKQDYSFQLHKIQLNDKPEIINYELKSEEGFLRELGMRLIGNDSLLITGFYSDESRNLVGSFSQIIYKWDSKNIEIKNHQRFSKEFIFQSKTDKEKKNIETAISKNELYDYHNYQLHKVIKTSKGYIAVFEQLYTPLTIRVSINAAHSQTPGGYMEDYYFVIIDKEGKVEKTTKIRKRQFNYFFAYGSLKHTSYKDKEIILIHEMGNRKSYSNPMKTTAIICIVMDETGTYSKYEIKDINDKLGITYRASNGWINGNTNISYTTKKSKKKFKLTTLNIEKLVQ